MVESAAEGNAITRRAGLAALGTLGSRLLGAVRDAVIAASFALPATDAFFVAWTIPNTLRRVLGEGAVSAAFIPIFSELDEREGREQARLYLQRFCGALLLTLLLVSALGVLGAPLLAMLYGGGYRGDAGKFSTVVQLTALVFPYILFAGVAALLSGALNAVGRFLLPAFSPALLNLALIATPWLFVPVALGLGLESVAGLGLAALVGGALQVLVQVPSLRRHGLSPRPRLAVGDPQVRRSFLLIAPLVLGTGVYQLNILLSRLLASFLPSGAQSYLYYAQRLVEIPQGMFAVAVASAALPSFARLHSQGDDAAAREAFGHSLRLSLFIAVPAAVALSVIAEPTVCMIFGRGAFGREQVVQTARALAWLAPGVWAVAATHTTTRMFYAYNDTRTPVLCAAANLLTFVALSAATMAPWGHVAIAAATSAAALLQLLLLLIMLRRRLGVLELRPLLVALVRAGVAATVMGVVIHEIAVLGRWELGGGHLPNLGVFVLLLCFGLAVYLAASYLLGSGELTALTDALRRRVAPGGAASDSAAPDP